MTDTLPRSDDHVPAPADEPVLVWAVEEEILLANDAGLLLIARHQREEPLRAAPASLAGTLARVVDESGRCRPTATGSPATPSAGASTPARWRVVLAHLRAWAAAVLVAVLG